jgi:hypothetical protein
MHRTTIIFNPELEKRLKQKARREGKSVTELVQMFIREGLNRDRIAVRKRKIELSSFDMGLPLLDIADRDTLWDSLD